MGDALRTLRAEHLALKAVARVIKMEGSLVAGGRAPDIPLLESIVEYLLEFPDRIHHPKEEEFIFKAMRRRSPEVGDLLDRLFLEHEQETKLIQELEEAVVALGRGGEEARGAFAEIARAYADFLEGHLQTEEDEAFPLAERILSEVDWAPIDQAFADNADPFLDGTARQRFAALHRRITALGLPPMGLGPDTEN